MAGGRRTHPCREVDGEAHRLRDLHVAQPHLGEPDGVGAGEVTAGRRAGRQRLHLETADGAGREAHDLTLRRQRLGPEVDGDGRARVEREAHAGDPAVAYAGPGLHERHVIGTHRLRRPQHQPLARRVAAAGHPPRGLEVAVDCVHGPVLRRVAVEVAVARCVDRPTLLLGEGPRRVTRPGERIEPLVVGVGGERLLPGAFGGAGRVTDAGEERLRAAPVGVGEDEVGALLEGLAELRRAERRELEHEVVAVHDPGGGVDDPLPVARDHYRVRGRGQRCDAVR